MPRRPVPTLAAALLTLAWGTAPTVCAQGGNPRGGSLRLDEETGRDLGNYLPAREFDHTHMLLELDFPDFARRAEAACRCHLTMTPIGTPRDTVKLDAQGMTITRVALEGAGELSFVHDGSELRVPLPRTVQPGESITLVIDYTLGPDQLRADGEALSWSPPTENPDGPSEEAPMLHSQGEAENAKRWFPCFDHPNERLSTELLVTADSAFEVVSNGELLSKEDAGDGRTRWHWDQELPHAPYLVSLVIGKFDVVEIAGPGTAEPDLPMPVYGPVGSADRIRESFARTPDMVAYFAKQFDEPYPWAKYSQAIVRDFAAGAMENTSATTFFPFAARAPAGALDDVISHELTHQWFGDLVTCKNWEHLWLQEGWATYGEALWEGEKAREEAVADGKSPEEADQEYRRAYLRGIRNNFRQASRGASRTHAPDDAAMVSNYYRDPDYTFMKANNPYSRGACVLHMLHERLGDEVFWRGVRLYLDRYKFSAAETSDFRKCLEEVSGDSLERFFRQWVYRAGTARVDVELGWAAGSEQFEGPGTLTVTLRQTQDIDADNPAYAMVVPLYLKSEDGSGEYVYIDTDRREVTQTFELDAPPSETVIDPYNWNILIGRVTKDIERPAEENVVEEHATEGAGPVGAGR